MKAAKATETSPLAEFFSSASDQRKREVYTQVISRAIASQLEVQAEAKEIIRVNRKDKASA
jgi:hypothetical protein